MYLSVRVGHLDILAQKREEHPPQEDAVSTAEGAPGRVGGGQQDRPIEQTPHGVVDLISG